MMSEAVLINGELLGGFSCLIGLVKHIVVGGSRPQSVTLVLLQYIWGWRASDVINVMLKEAKAKRSHQSD